MIFSFEKARLTVDEDAVAILYELSEPEIGDALERFDLADQDLETTIDKVVAIVRLNTPSIDWEGRRVKAIRLPEEGPVGPQRWAIELSYRCRDPNWLLDYISGAAFEVLCNDARDQLTVTAVLAGADEHEARDAADELEFVVKARLADLMRHVQRYHQALPYLIRNLVIRSMT